MKQSTTWGTTATVMIIALAACGGDGSGDSSAGYDYEPNPPAPPENQTFQDYGANEQIPAAEQNQSTFALDVDTGSYAITRASLTDGLLPDPASVRTEEFVNYFTQDYPAPASGIGIHVDGTSVPFLNDPAKHVIRVGLQGAAVEEVRRRPVNLTIVADVSGSMAGEKLDMVKTGLGRLVDSLRLDDRMAIVTYSTDARLLMPMTPLRESMTIHAAIDGLAPQQQTNLEAGLRIGYDHARANLTEQALNRVVLLSDGVANVGETDPDRLAGQIAQEAGDTTQLVVVGVGRDTYNDVILEQFADQGNGFYAFLDSPAEAERLFVDDLTATLQAVALDAKVQITFNPEVVSHYRLLGYENRQLEADDLRDDTVDGGEIGAGHTVTALYEVTLTEGAELRADTSLATVEVRYDDPGTGRPDERSAIVTTASIASSFDVAPARLRQDVLVAAFAEVLRGAPWADKLSIAQIAENVAALSVTMPSDTDVAELAGLTRTAAGLTG